MNEIAYYVTTEWLTCKQVAKELGMDYTRILALTKRKNDPLPAYLIDGNRRQARVYRPELNQWIFRNSETVTHWEECS